MKPEIKAFFERFYAISDTPDDHEKYADMFTENAKLIMASNAVEGRDGKQACHHSVKHKLIHFSNYPDAIRHVGEGCQEIACSAAVVSFWIRL